MTEPVRDSTPPTIPQDPSTFFAAERTFLAWIRTGLSLMGFGFVVARFGLFLREIALTRGEPLKTGAFSRWFGIALLGLGVVLTLGAIADHVATVRRLKAGEPFAGRPTWVGIAVAVVLVVLGLAMAAYLFWWA